MSKYSNIHLCLLVIILCLTFCSCRRGWLKEGAPCQNGVEYGTCTSVNKCRSNNPGRNVNDFPLCSIHRRTKIICCPNDENIKTITDPLTRKPLRKIGQKAWDKCLDYLKDVDYPCKAINRVNRLSAVFGNALENFLHKSKPIDKSIAGGRDARRTQFPHMALLGYGNERTSISWMCGGSLISDKFVLTAGHCIADDNGQKVAHIALGILKRTDPPRLWQRHLVRRIIPHPDYQPPTKYNDIALLETATRVLFSATVAPACLAIPKPPHVSMTLRKRDACATGWGFLGRNQKLADNLQVAYLKEYDYKKCSKLYPVHRLMPEGLNSTTQVCYGDDHNSKDTCQGDSGGPLQIPGQASDCQHSIIGVTSYGLMCPSMAGMYTRVQSYISWIESVVWP